MNEDLFTGKAGLYAKFRPAYPSALMEYLAGFLPENSCAADIGAGTGIFTGQLSQIARTVYAVEPNADMLSQARDFLSGKENITFINAPAENIPLPDKSLDMITSAQAFHWFDENAFRAECVRLLKTNAYVAVIWNTRVDNEFNKERTAIMSKYCERYKNGHAGKNSAAQGDISEERFLFKNGIHRI